MSNIFSTLQLPIPTCEYIMYMLCYSWWSESNIQDKTINYVCNPKKKKKLKLQDTLFYVDFN